jgi:hypothetical protein
MNKFTLIQHDSNYYDYDKELQAVPDDVRTSVDMRLTFDTEKHTAYFTLSTRNDNGDTIDWCDTHDVPWSAAIRMLITDGLEVPEELLGEIS